MCRQLDADALAEKVEGSRSVTQEEVEALDAPPPAVEEEDHEAKMARILSETKRKKAEQDEADRLAKAEKARAAHKSVVQSGKYGANQFDSAPGVSRSSVSSDTPPVIAEPSSEPVEEEDQDGNIRRSIRTITTTSP